MASKVAVGTVNALSERTARMNVSVRLADKQAPGKRQLEPAQLLTNVWGVIPQKNMPVYRYDVRIYQEFPPRKEGTAVMKEVTKQCKEDYPSIERKNMCVAVYRVVLEQAASFFGKMEALVYDRASILYSLDRLPLQSDETKSLVIAPSQLPEGTVSQDCVRLHFHVKACSEDFELTMNDLKQGVDEGDGKNRSLQQLFELLASQEAFFTEGRFVSYGTGQSYLFDPYEFGFVERDMPPLPEGKYVGVGAAKGVKLIEGPQGPGSINAALFLDVKKAAFHIENQTVADKVAMVQGTALNRLRLDARTLPVIKKLLKGIYVRCTYGKQRTFVVSNVSQQNASQCKFDTDKGKMTVEHYFKTQLNEPLQFPLLPLVCERKGNRDNFYPMEKLVVCENQRVTQTQQSSAQVQAMIKACATLPKDRLRQTQAMSTALCLDGKTSNRWMKEFSVKTTSSLSVTGRVLPPPTIEYARNGQAAVNADKSSWVANRNMYLRAARCDRWLVVGLVSSSERFFNNDKLNMYVAAFLRQTQQRGMHMAQPLSVQLVSAATEQSIDLAIAKAKQLNASFVHFVQSDNLHLHGHMKLAEAREQVLTQDVTTRTADQAPHKWQTMDNIVNKTNLKLGGINFSLRLESEQAQRWLMNPTRLIVGLDVAHPPTAAVRGVDKSTVPSVIGYSSNCKQFPLDFVGGYRYATADMEQLTDATLKAALVESMHAFHKHRKALPEHVIVLRDGISEGQYQYAIECEVGMVKQACGEVGGNKYRPHITFVVVTKMHNLRLYKKNIPPGKAADQNIKPGTVVDKYIISPNANEFYLNSHSAFQGTAKTPRYTTLFDTAKLPNDELQGVVYALTYNHQIVNAAISLPAPVLVAARMASRGRNNYITQFGDASHSTEGPPPNLEQLNADLGYMDKPLSGTRFNA